METKPQESADKSNESMGIPGAIVVAGIIIAIAVIYTGGKKSGTAAPTPTPTTNQADIVAAQKAQQAKLAENSRPIDTTRDHLLGNPAAPVKIIEYTDLECYYCKQFHPVVRKIMEEYGKTGEVAWVFRHFPLAATLHPKALPAAIAAECVWNQVGEEGFWNYVDALFAADLTNQDTDHAIFESEALKLGVKAAPYKTCVDAAVTTRIQSDIDDGLAAGVGGTPYSIVIGKSGKRYPINGAQTYENVKTIIELALQEK